MNSKVIGNSTLYFSDCLDALRTMPDNSVDSVVTDPPYGLSFMGKKWDYDVPSEEIWRECFRVLKPGGHLLAFAGTRTQHRMAVRIEDAGFDIRDMIAWLYGSGFPKSHNLEGKWDGWGTALKPALEPITLARKPLIGTVAENVISHNTGALNIDGCRVELNGDYKCKANGRPSQTGLPDNYDSATANQPDTVGRWPANLIHDGSEEVMALFPNSNGSGAARTLSRNAKIEANGCGMNAKSSDAATLRDAGTGSAARFFYCAKASRKDRNEGLPSIKAPIVSHNATMREIEDANWKARNGNHHPTVKPTDLMRYLCRLITPPNGTVLDPFMGSGSTGKAAKLEGFGFVGIEREQEYFDIACARIEAVQLRADGTPVQHTLDL